MLLQWKKWIDIELAQEFDSYKTKWEILKLAICGSSTQYSARKRKAKNNLLQVLEKKLHFIQKKQKNLPLSLIESNGRTSM